MKPTMLSRKNASYLFDHVLDGFHTTNQGLQQLKEKGMITTDEYTVLLEKNSSRLIERIREFKVLNKLICVFFAALFTWMQICNDELDMRRPGSVRTSNARTSRTGGRSGGRGGRKGKEGKEGRDGDGMDIISL